MTDLLAPLILGDKTLVDTYIEELQLGHTIDQADVVKLQLIAAREAMTCAACRARAALVGSSNIVTISLFMAIVSLDKTEEDPGDRRY